MTDGPLEARLKEALAELEALQEAARVAAHLLPWHSGSIPGDPQRCALARFLGWKLEGSIPVTVNGAMVFLEGGVALPLPPPVAAYQTLDGAGPNPTPVPPSPEHRGADPPSDLARRVAASKRRDTANGLIGLGIILVITGGIVLLSPFVQLAGEPGSISLFSANGICSSGFGQFAQGVSSGAAQTCGTVSLGFFGAWAGILLGGAALLIGIFRR